MYFLLFILVERHQDLSRRRESAKKLVPIKLLSDCSKDIESFIHENVLLLSKKRYCSISSPSGGIKSRQISIKRKIMRLSVWTNYLAYNGEVF
jgi:hypothetical protein